MQEATKHSGAAKSGHSGRRERDMQHLLKSTGCQVGLASFMLNYMGVALLKWARPRPTKRSTLP